MDKKFLVIIIASALINAMGSVVLKFSTVYKNSGQPNEGLHNWLMIGALLIFAVSFPLYGIGLSKIKLSVAQPIFASTTFLTVSLIAVLLFKEAIEPLKLAGMGIMLVGIFLVAS
jgi:multidrug transporter EmrE-like cation transporter